MDATDESLPLRGGCWVMQGTGTGIRVAKVKACYRMGGEILLDLWMYARDGERLGRTSPVCGGPRSFEPACAFEGWVRIEEPAFPPRPAWVPTGDGEARTMGYSGTKVIPFGRFLPRKPAARQAAPKARHSDYDPQLEASSRRLAAQELRDLARTMPPEAADGLKARATELEAEADALAPRR